jgi:(1->4)-alpha-D-glucan 1-alpha-D-glucosylmutase
MQKATREAKVHTSWINPNEEFDTALHVFIDRLLNPESPGATEFLEDLREFSAEVSRYGMINSLAQVLIKMFVPGVPDIYQGQELWDFSLVDPDNRRPVDFEFRRRMLSDLRQRMEEDRRALVKDLLANWEDGRIKMYVTHVALLCRRERAELARIGDYVPLRTAGVQARHLFTFARWSAEEGIVVVAVPRLCRIFERKTGGLVTTPSAWGNTRIQLSELMGARQFRNLFTDERIDGDELLAAELFADFPVALLGSI